MARPPTGAGEALERARQTVATASTVSELRAAQAVLLPLDFNLTLAQTARIVGGTPAGVSRLRRAFILGTFKVDSAPGRGGRRRFLFSEDEEFALVKRAAVYADRTYNTSVRNEFRKLLFKWRPDGVGESTITGILTRVAAKWLSGVPHRHLTYGRRHLIQQWAEELKKEEAKRS